MGLFSKIFGGNKKQENNSEFPDILYFKSNKAAFEYSCQFMDCSIRENIPLPALVQSVILQDDGIQNTKLLVASNEGGITFPALTLSKLGPKLSPDDLVSWYPVQNVGLFWIGIIIAQLEPSLHMKNGWKIKESFQQTG